MTATADSTRAGGGNPAIPGTAPDDHTRAPGVDPPGPAQPGSAKAPDDKSGKTLEWIKAIGMPVVTLLATLIGGYYFTNLTKDREQRESSERLYAQLLTQREQSDTQIRKDMFGVVISRFLEDAKKPDWDDKVLNLELLAGNFDQILDLAPLFKEVARGLTRESPKAHPRRADLKKRLDVTANQLNLKQLSSLARRGQMKREILRLEDVKKNWGTPFIDAKFRKSDLIPASDLASGEDKEQIRIVVEVLEANFERRELEVRLLADFSGEPPEKRIDRHFWVGQYDFPMLDNTQLPHGLRASVVITEFDVPEAVENPEAATSVICYLVVFPAASASFKERQDYDDILADMLRAKANPRGRTGETLWDKLFRREREKP